MCSRRPLSETTRRQRHPCLQRGQHSKPRLVYERSRSSRNLHHVCLVVLLMLPAKNKNKLTTYGFPLLGLISHCPSTDLLVSTAPIDVSCHELMSDPQTEAPPRGRPTSWISTSQLSTPFQSTRMCWDTMSGMRS